MTAQGQDTKAEAPAAISNRAHLISWALVLGIAALVLLFVFSDARKLWEIAATLDVWRLSIPLVCALLSYVLMALSYQGIAHAAGAAVSFWEMLKITFVANTVNYVVSTGGLSGFAVRLYFFIRLKIPSDMAVIVSLVQGVVTNLILLLFVVVGFAYLLTTHTLHGYALVTTVVLLFFFVLVAVLAVMLLVHRQFRRWALIVLAEAVHWFMHRFFPRHKLGRVHIWRFQRNLNRGIEFVMARVRLIVIPTWWI